ncbi:bacteriohemerythrin [Alkaliphilus crotonatoxidans]
MFNWTPDLALGNTTIDKQHQELIEHASKIYDALRAGQGKSLVREQTTFLKKYIQEHFEEEERLHAQHQYHYAQNHREAHRNFLKHVTELENELLSAGESSSLAIKINKIMNIWFKEHIKRADKDFIDFMAKKKA